MTASALSSLIKQLPGPILVIGASGFIGANLLHALLAERDDVTGTFFSGISWRLRGVPAAQIQFCNLNDPISVRTVLASIEPRVIFDCSSYGAYSFEQDAERIHTINYASFLRLLEEITRLPLHAYIHAGSSSEYGLNANAPAEDALLLPNSHYAVSKCAAAAAISYFGKCRDVPVVNLRLYSVYGSFEDSSRLVPVLCEHASRGVLPPFAKPETSRDFIHIDDVVAAFIQAALRMTPEIAGESFNIGSGAQTSLAELAALARDLFHIDAEPEFSPGAGRTWDVDIWRANPAKTKQLLGWTPSITLKDGLQKTFDWWRERLKSANFNMLTKKGEARPTKTSISAVIACYRDAEAIPIMYERLKTVFNHLGLDYEIIFVNDGSPDDSEERILNISARDPGVIGITHSRNFGSQAAFRSGMELCSKEACVLLDGDLQDPPEIIEKFVEEWRAGADVVYGRRVKREMSRFVEWCYRAFYRLFDAMSDIPIPRHAGDFSLMDRSVVYWLLRCTERDSFLRGLRAYVGFNQISVDYLRPERMFGKSTNNWIKNFGWAKKAIFSFSRLPLHLLTAFGGVAFVFAVLLALVILFMRIVFPASVPQGVTTMLLVSLCFGSATILGLGILGEYIGKILEETKARPPFIRRHIISTGSIKRL
ncbi:MAG: NAD-dependent epimerase/dehydratase family protein [Betaproteobacteria bacterium]|nr:NAD-dependent epimerase/dehydratase family protein [Betaproteobacteria bacterium]